MNVNKSINLVDVITDEVALEGLDGITLEALWQRLAVRLDEKLPLKLALMEQIWGLCLEIHGFSFFELDKPRGNLVIFDRYELEYLSSEADKIYLDSDLYCSGDCHTPPSVRGYYEVCPTPESPNPRSTDHIVPPNTRRCVTASGTGPDQCPGGSSRTRKLKISFPHVAYPFAYATLCVYTDSKNYDQKEIYEQCPIEDTKLGVRGSCASYNTRKNMSKEIKGLSLSEAEQKYGQKLVIVASQGLREQALMEVSTNPTLQLPLSHYILLERIGRTRYLGDITIKKTSSVKEDAKTMFYIRKGLLENGLIRKQVYYQGNTGMSYTGQNMGTLVHLTRFFNTRKPKVICWAEHLINYLKSKENYAAEYNEVKNELNLDYSIKKFFKIHLLQKVFRTDVKVPYRSYYPNSLDKEWQTKSNATKERIVKLVTLTDPNIEINDFWRSEEIKEDENEHYILDISNQKLNVPFLQQAYKVIEASGCKGISQMELASQLGFTKLISRTLVRNLVKTKIVSTYIDDIGRQRTTKFVSRKWDDKNTFKKQMEEEISKMKEYSRSVQIEKSKEKTNNNTVINDDATIQENDIPDKEDTPLPVSEMSILPKNDSQPKFNDIQANLFSSVNQILKKYKLFNKKMRYKYTSIENCNKLSKLKDERLESKRKQANKEPDLFESDFYKTIETKLVVQKPECKKKSQKVAVVGIMGNLDNTDMSLNVSYRLIHRANMVIECVKQHKVIEDTQKLMKYINTEETNEGLDSRCDKNSLIRLLQKLAEDNLIKNIKLVMKNKKQTNQKIINFICDPSIDVNDALIQSAVEQAKLKFCMSSVHDALDNNAQMVGFNKFMPVTRRPYLVSLGSQGIHRKTSTARIYGYNPKFLRLKYVHIFMYYLIYDHSQNIIPKKVFLENLAEEDRKNAEEALKNFPHLYYKEIDWRMFIPPLPKHKAYPEGWALMADVHLRMPLSLFVKVINVNFEVPGLQELLEHPIKRHYLVKDVPTPIRNLLFLKRKYIFNIHEIVTRLCYLGLAQFGPQKLKEKDQVFVYLNRNTELLDTTSSCPGYHRVEDKPYPSTKFVFASMAVVENYWYEMWNICINTCLGGRLVVEGKDILLEDLARKPEMIQATKVRSPEEATNNDTGFVPGDRKGAAGIDSAFFAHLKRNWNWINSDVNSKHFALPRAVRPLGKLDKSERRNAAEKKVNQVSRRKISTSSSSSSLLSKSSSAKSIKSNVPDSGGSKPKLQRDKPTGKLAVPIFPQATCSKPPKVIRKVLPRKQKRKRVKYDEVDIIALQRMDKLRVDWEQHEDNILLVCKVAMMYLCPNPRRNLITFAAIRDVLRDYSFTSHNKTSKACQRRLLYMLKQPKTHNSVLLGVEELKQDFYVNKRFGGIVDKIRAENANDYEQEIEKIFKDLVSYVARKYYNIANMEYREPIALPKTVQEFNLFYQLKLPSRTIKSPGITKEVHEVNDIHTCTINSVIHSSMCCGKERRSWAYQLFKVYQQYPEYLLRNAMLKIRADKMVTMKKSYMCANKKFGNCMPMSSSQYQLSSSYFYKFQTKWPYQIFSETYNILLTLLENYVERKAQSSELWLDGVEVKPDDGGIVAVLHDYLSTEILDIDIEIPDQIIMLDPGLPQRSEVYQQIATRYQAILEALSTNAKDSQDELFRDNSNDQPDSDHQSLVETHYFKRPYEVNGDINSLPRAKKQKLDNNDISATIDHAQNEKVVSETTSSIDDEIKAILGGAAKNVDHVKENVLDPSDFLSLDNEDVNSKKVESRPESVSTNFSLQNFSCDWLDGFQNTGPSNMSTENVQKHAQTISTNEKEANQATLHASNVSLCDSEDTRASTSTRVSRLMKQAKSDAKLTMIENLESRSDIQDARTKQTRIAMLQMREELQDLTLDDNHHAYEYFVVNSFKLLYSLLTTEGDELETSPYQGKELPKKLLPLDIDLVNGLLDDIKKHAIFPKEQPNLDEVKNELDKRGCVSFEWEDVETVCKFIKNKAEFGATLHELVIQFNHLGNMLAEILALITEKRIILRAGIVTVRYIHHRYINPWIIHSYKILRLEKEAHQTIPEGSVYLLDGEEGLPDKDNETNRVYNAANLFYAPPLKSLNKDKKNNENVSDMTKNLDAQSHESISNKRKIDQDDISHESKKQKISSEIDKPGVDIQTETPACENKKNNDEDETLEPKESNANSATSGLDNFDAQINDKVPSKDKKNDDESEKSKDVPDNVSENIESQRRLRRKRTLLLKQKDVYRAAKLLDFNTAEEIKVVIKPWIRIDGVLNRRVLDRMLGAVLCYCMERPGLSLTAVQNRFSPAIQPYHTRELVEILVKLNCVKAIIQQVPKVTLFSKPGKIDYSGNPDLVANSDNYIIEPTMQCALKFGMFLSNKSYNLDFLSTL